MIANAIRLYTSFVSSLKVMIMKLELAFQTLLEK